MSAGLHRKCCNQNIWYCSYIIDSLLSSLSCSIRIKPAPLGRHAGEFLECHESAVSRDTTESCRSKKTFIFSKSEKVTSRTCHCRPVRRWRRAPMRMTSAGRPRTGCISVTFVVFVFASPSPQFPNNICCISFCRPQLRIRSRSHSSVCYVSFTKQDVPRCEWYWSWLRIDHAEDHPSGKTHVLVAGSSCFSFNVVPRHNKPMAAIHHPNVPGWCDVIALGHDPLKAAIFDWNDKSGSNHADWRWQNDFTHNLTGRHAVSQVHAPAEGDESSLYLARARDELVPVHTRIWILSAAKRSGWLPCRLVSLSWGFEEANQ